MKTVSYSPADKLNSVWILPLTFFASVYGFLAANLYAVIDIPVSFPYCDTGMIRESYRNYNGQAQAVKSKQGLFIGVKLNPLVSSVTNFLQTISRYNNNRVEYELVI
ncbi:MAG TPA: hypothetical protein PLL35_00165 [Candidatus Cloacimonas sp.]|nr:hypothetical protein [Candidatus Cloacimonas sp.]